MDYVLACVVFGLILFAIGWVVGIAQTFLWSNKWMKDNGCFICRERWNDDTPRPPSDDCEGL